MILTGAEIAGEIAGGRITFHPFDLRQINPNSINYRLGPFLKEFVSTDGDNHHRFRLMRIPATGYLLRPLQVYLGHTMEVIGSTRYAMSLIGRSSMGRLGLFLQVSANLGHTTSCHRWTLELVATSPVRIYPGMRIGQVTFWTNRGDLTAYHGVCGRHHMPTAADVSWLRSGEETS